MRPFRIVILSPCLNDFLRVAQAYKNIVIQAFISEFAVEALDVSVLNRLPRLDKPELDVVLVSP